MSSINKILLSVVIPAYNEEFRLGATLDRLYAFFNSQGYLNQDFEVLVVDDGSCDKTAELTLAKKTTYLNLRLLSYPKNEGKGYAVRYGVSNSKGDLVLMADADGATPFEEFLKLKKAVDNGANLALGSRALRPGEVKLKTSVHRKIIGRVFSCFVRLILGIKILDTQCGFKLFDREVVTTIFPKLKLKDFAFDVELIFLCMKQDIKIEEVPVNWFSVEGSKVNLIEDSLKMFLDLFFVRVNYLRDRYEG